MLETISLEILKKIAPEIAKKVGGGAERTYQRLKSKISNACHRYDKSYRERHGQVKVFCAGMRKPISLDDIYVAVQFLNQHTASQYKSAEELEQAFRERGRRPLDSTSDERQDGTQVANDRQYLMVLGGPGVGKSTFLRKVGLEALKGKDGSFAHECISVFLELKRFTEEQIDIEVLITQEFEICGYPHPKEMTKAALKSGKLLILLDGLDEVPTTNVDNVIRKIGDFVDRYRQNRFIASCRIAAYRGGFTRFTEVEMADFNDAQVKRYIENWFDSTPDRYRHQLDKERQTADRCWKALNAEKQQATKELAWNPLLLTLFCMVYDRSQNFPRNRADLYKKALNIFLEEWAAEKRVHRGAPVNQYLDIADEKRMLSEIAAKNFETNRLFFDENELIAQIQEFGEGSANTLPTFNASKILDMIVVDQGLLVERISNFYSFSHLTFQEYLTANYIVRDTRSIRALAKKHLHNDQWREIFLLTSGLMYEADDLLIEMGTEAPKLIKTNGLRALFQWVEQIINTTDGRYSGYATRAFAICQFLLLSVLNKVHKRVEYKPRHFQDPERYLYRNLYLDYYRDLYLDCYRDLYRNFDRDLYRALYQNFYQGRDRNRDFDRYLNQVRYLSPNLLAYHDFYRYMDTDFHSSGFSKFGNKFDRDLSERIKVVKRMQEAKIFKGVDLQRMVQRFNEEREFIKATGKGESVESPAESIHDTWLSVLDITDDMLTISEEDIRDCIQYLRAVELIFACKEASGRVSPEVWKKIEERLLA